MKIVYIAAGAAGTYCGACARDVALAGTLTALGHQLLLVPLYTPLRVDGRDPSISSVYYGGINAYLQQRHAFFRRPHGTLDKLLDNPSLLRWISRFALSTRPEELGEMTVSVLRGEEGFQKKELDKLIRFLAGQRPIDVINIGNALLLGLAGALRKHFGAPLVCTLQGEESFVERLPEPFRARAVELMRSAAKTIDAFVASSETCAARASRFLKIEAQKVRLVRPGIEVENYLGVGPRHRSPFRVGYLSRISPDKGFDILRQAFCILHRRKGGGVLAVAGQIPRGEEPFWKAQRDELARIGLSDRMEYAGEPDLNAKTWFLKSCSVFCLPSRVVEYRGIACLEALAAGVPSIVPDRGVFPEIIRLTGGGLLVPPEDPEALADAIASLRDDPEKADRLGQRGTRGVAEHFAAEKTARETLELYAELAGG